MSTTTRTAQDIRNDIAKLEGELAALSGEGLEVWHGTYGDLRDCPPGGATLTVEWAISDQSYRLWYPTTEAAKAALAALARREGTVPDDNGWHVDLTAPGCHSSKAYVTRRSPDVRELTLGPDETHNATTFARLQEAVSVIYSGFDMESIRSGRGEEPPTMEANPWVAFADACWALKQIA